MRKPRATPARNELPEVEVFALGVRRRAREIPHGPRLLTVPSLLIWTLPSRSRNAAAREWPHVHGQRPAGASSCAFNPQRVTMGASAGAIRCPIHRCDRAYMTGEMFLAYVVQCCSGAYNRFRSGPGIREIFRLIYRNWVLRSRLLCRRYRTRLNALHGCWPWRRNHRAVARQTGFRCTGRAVPPIAAPGRRGQRPSRDLFPRAPLLETALLT